MITKEDGLRYAKLIHVSVDNGKTGQSNKVYNMVEQADGQIKCEWGRVGLGLKITMKPSNQWDKIYKSKTSKSKNYTDVTDMISEAIEEVDETNDKTVDIDDVIVRKLINDLMSYANQSIQKNYKVTQDAVTQAQVDNAQAILDTIAGQLKVKVKIKTVNDELLKLYTVIPRKMQNVKDHLLEPITDKAELEEAQEFLANEQDTLDTMAGQVQLLSQKKAITTDTKTTKPKDITILEQMGLKVEVELNAKTLKLVNKLMGSHRNRVNKVFKVINTKTQKKFDKHYDKAKDKNRLLLFHGSGNRNWFNIAQTGLLIRPSGAGYNGSMWDDGVYFADDSDKSLGYTDGGRWSGGGGVNKVYLGLFDVHIGKQLNRYKWDNSCTRISREVKGTDYDSVHAHKGQSLRKDEFIIYNSDQCTITYLIEVNC